MELMKFILWLTAGAVIGWFANRIVTTEYAWNHKLTTPEEIPCSEES